MACHLATRTCCRDDVNTLNAKHLARKKKKKVEDGRPTRTETHLKFNLFFHSLAPPPMFSVHSVLHFRAKALLPSLPPSYHPVKIKRICFNKPSIQVFCNFLSSSLAIIHSSTKKTHLGLGLPNVLYF